MPEALDPLFEPLDPLVLNDPYTTYRQLREKAPVYWHQRLRSWVLTRFRECEWVLKNPDRFASDVRRTGVDVPPAGVTIQLLDPPEHTALRRLFVDALRAQEPRRLETRIRERLEYRLDALAGKDEINFATEVAAPTALDTIVQLLGVPAPDLSWFAEISQLIVDGMDAGLVPEAREPGIAARTKLAALAAEWLEAADEDGYVGYLARRMNNYPGVDPAAATNSVRTLVHAGYESAGRFLGNALAALLQDEGGLKPLLDADPAAAVDELVRFAGPVQADARVCLAEMEMAGQTIRAGDTLVLLIAAANRDPERFHAPDRLDLCRTPNPHLGFGRGSHSCLGASLAMMLGTVVFGTLASRYPGTELAAPPVWRPNATLRGLAELPVRLRS